MTLRTDIFLYTEKLSYSDWGPDFLQLEEGQKLDWGEREMGGEKKIILEKNHPWPRWRQWKEARG